MRALFQAAMACANLLVWGEAKMTQGVLFDFNGTLFLDTDKHEIAWREIYRKYRGRDISSDEYAAFIHGRAFPLVTEYVLGKDVSEEERYNVMIEKEILYRELVRADPAGRQLVHGAADLLDELQARGIPFTIATASEITNVRFFFDIFSLSRWFAGPESIVYDDGTFPGKPAPDIYLRAAKLIGVAPADCLVVEDSPAGIKAAENAGVGKIVAMKSILDTAKVEGNPIITAVIDNFEGFIERFL